MLFRISLVALFFAILLGLAYKFSDTVFVMLQDYWALDAAGRDQWLDTAKLAATVLGILGVLGAFIAKVIEFMQGKSASKSESVTPPAQSVQQHTYNTHFKGNVKIKGDNVWY